VRVDADDDRGGRLLGGGADDRRDLERGDEVRARLGDLQLRAVGRRRNPVWARRPPIPSAEVRSPNVSRRHWETFGSWTPVISSSSCSTEVWLKFSVAT
jgi:hypothetical protein